MLRDGEVAVDIACRWGMKSLYDKVKLLIVLFVVSMDMVMLEKLYHEVSTLFF